MLARWTEKCATQRRPNTKPSGPRASGSNSKTKRKLSESQVAETVKKLLKASDTIELDVDTSSDIKFESDSELEE